MSSMFAGAVVCALFSLVGQATAQPSAPQPVLPDVQKLGPQVGSRVPDFTLLDQKGQPHFKQAFGDGRVLQDWFANVLLYSEVATLAGPYSDFASIGGDFRSVAKQIVAAESRQA